MISVSGLDNSALDSRSSSRLEIRIENPTSDSRSEKNKEKSQIALRSRTEVFDLDNSRKKDLSTLIFTNQKNVHGHSFLFKLQIKTPASKLFEDKHLLARTATQLIMLV